MPFPGCARKPCKTMNRLDFRKELKQLYCPSATRASGIDVPEMNFLMLDGRGKPCVSRSFRDGIGTLLELSSTIRRLVCRGPLQLDYAPMPLEELWRTNSLATFSLENRASWKWTIMIMQPDFVNHATVEEARNRLQEERSLPALETVRFEALSEGHCAQIMHLGMDAEERQTIERLYRFIAACGCKPHGRHHKIHLCDRRKTDPSKWKTVLRQPMQ